MSEPTVEPLQGAVVVDDQLALLAALGALPASLGVAPVTTCAWQQRVLGAFVAPRSTAGSLQRLAASVGANAAVALAASGAPDPALLLIADPRPLAVAIARLRVTGANPLAAELIATARSLDATVLLSQGNAHGHVADRVRAAGLSIEVWDIASPLG